MFARLISYLAWWSCLRLFTLELGNLDMSFLVWLFEKVRFSIIWAFFSDSLPLSPQYPSHIPHFSIIYTTLSSAWLLHCWRIFVSPMDKVNKNLKKSHTFGWTTSLLFLDTKNYHNVSCASHSSHCGGWCFSCASHSSHCGVWGYNDSRVLNR